MHMHVCVLGVKKYYFFGKGCVRSKWMPNRKLELEFLLYRNERDCVVNLQKF